MSMIDIHDDARKSPNVAYNMFLNKYQPNKKVVYGFVEGKDDATFYKYCVRQRLPREWDVIPIIAKGKPQVYNVSMCFDWSRFNKSQICFFVDRDLTEIIPADFPQDENIYVTTWHSIENYIVDRTTFSQIITEYFGYEGIDVAHLEKMCDSFDEQLCAFLEATIPIMAWIVHWMRSGLRPQLDNISMDDIFSLCDGRIQPHPNLKSKKDVALYLHEKCKVNYTRRVPVARIEKELRCQKEYMRFTRGKFVLWFLIKYCNAVQKDPGKFVPEMKKPPKARALSHADVLLSIVPRVRIPCALAQFVDNTFRVYIKGVEASTGCAVPQ